MKETRKKEEETEAVFPVVPAGVNCRNLGSGGSCEGNFDCEDICEEIFSKHTAESKCIDLNENLVADFYEIFVIMEDGDDFESINPDSLNCLLNVSDTEFSREVGKLRKAESETFLEVLALDEDLTDVLSSEENILEKTFRQYRRRRGSFKREN